MFRIFILLIAVYPVLFIWQGLDVTDMGFWLTNYNLIFSNPEQVVSGFSCYLSEIIGGLWLLLFGGAGVIGLKLGYIAVLYAIMFSVYQVLKDFFRKEQVVVAIFIALIFITKSCANWISYNNLTALFYALSALFLYKAINNKSRLFAFFAGLFIALNPFIRFSNILGLSLLLLPVYYDLRNRRNNFASFNYSACLSGFVTGFISIFCLMLTLGHFQLFVKSIIDLFHMASSTSDYSGSNLFAMFIRDHLQTFKTGGVILFCYFLFMLISSLSRFTHHKLLKLLIGAGSGILSYYFLPLRKYLELWLGKDAFEFTGVLYGALIIVFIINVLRKLRDRSLQQSIKVSQSHSNDLVDFHINGKQKQEFLILLSLFILVLTPLGSGNGIKNSIFGMWFAFPLVCCMVFELKEIRIGGIVVLNANSIHITNITVITIILLFSFTTAWHYTYRDSSERKSMVYGIDHPKLRGVRTSKKRAEVVQQFLNVIPEYVKNGDQLLAVECIPLIYYLTDTRPFLNTSWPLISSINDLKTKIKTAEERCGSLPPVVKATIQTRHYSWPDNQSMGLYNSNPDLVNKRALLSTFIKNNKYSKVWQNNAFEIWMPGLSTVGDCFYEYDYLFDDFSKECKNIERISNTDWNKIPEDILIDKKDFRTYSSPVFAVQGMRGNFTFQRRLDGDRSYIRISPVGIDSGSSECLLQMGPSIDIKRLTIIAERKNICALSVKIRCRFESVPTLFVQDQAGTWKRRNSVKGVIAGGELQEYLVYKAIRNNATLVTAGFVWKPKSDEDWVDIESMDLFLCQK